MYVIAGATGHVGSVVATKLLAKGKPIKVIVRDAAKGTSWSKQGAEVAVGTLDDAAFLATTLRGAEGFFTLLPPNYAAKDLYADQRKTADVIASAVKTSGVPHVVMLSSVGADLADGNGPIKGLHYLENALRATGTVLTALRAGYFMENIQSSLMAMQQAGIYPNFTPSADAPMPMIATKDIGALAADLLLTKPARSEVVDLHGPSYTTRQLAEKLGVALGKPAQIVDIPQSEWIPTMTRGGLPQPFAEAFAEMYSGFAGGLIRPKGDRMEQGRTPVDEVIAALLKH
jgi:uncharacterized protein YbjT (DUF2867 family)